MTNYVQLVNKTLVRINEVTLDEAGSDFDTTRGPQQLAKAAVNNSIRLILQEAQEWPFLKTTYTQATTASVREYNYAADWSSSDVGTFYLKPNTTLGTQGKVLKVITYDDYVQNYRTLDDAGRTGVPELIYQTYGGSFGVYPTPNDTYEIEYIYWAYPSDLTLYSDTCIIPSRFDHVVVDGAVMYLMRFRSNDQSAAIHQQSFKEGIKTMRRVLFDDMLEARTTVLPGRS